MTEKKRRKAAKPAPKASATPSAEATTEAEAPGVLLSSTATKVSASLGIVVAMVLATLVNVLVARHYRRWDVTRGGLYTLSEATVATLHDLPEKVKIYVLLPGGEPLTLSVQHLLDGYLAETSRLEVELLDPDRRPAEFLSLAQHYGIGADREDGRMVAGAAALVVRGDRREILRMQELVEVDAEDDLRRRPRLEQAFTGALRAVTSGDHPRACFTGGHGEDESKPLRDHLVRNGYEVTGIEPARSGDKTSLDECKVLVIAGPREKVPAEDVARWTAYLDKGGAALLAVGPEADGDDRGFADLGLDRLLGGFGLSLDRDFVFELTPRLRAPNGRGETFTPTPRAHPATRSLMKMAERGLVPVLTVASSLSATGAGTAAVTPLLVTSDQAFGMVDFLSWSTGAPRDPERRRQEGPAHGGVRGRAAGRGRGRSSQVSRRGRQARRAARGGGLGGRPLGRQLAARGSAGGRRSSPRAPSPGWRRGRPSSTSPRSPPSPPASV